MDDHGTNHRSHESGTNKECISVLEGCAWCKFKDEVVVYSCSFPHEQVAPIQKQVQA